MKYIIILCDGMSDEPLKELEGKTPMEIAHKPHMNHLAKHSELGLVRTVPEGMEAGSDTANLSVLGYDPKLYYTGRSSIEALSMKIPMEESDVSLRCNLVTLTEEEDTYEDKKIIDHGAGEITTEEAALLIEEINKHFASEKYHFYPGVSYRHILMEKNGQVSPLIGPHDVLTQRIGEHLPAHPTLKEMMEKSYEILKDHPVNISRKERGLLSANSIWFWGAGTKPAYPSFKEKFGKKAALLSAVDLLKGIAVGTEMTSINVPGATGGLDSNFEGEAKAALKALTKDGYDFVYLHLEAPDEMGHQGSIENKILAIETIDQKVLPIILNGLTQSGEDYRIMILPDHPTPVKARTHTADPVPYLLYDSRKKTAGSDIFSEKTAKESGILIDPGHKLMNKFFTI